MRNALHCMHGWGLLLTSLLLCTSCSNRSFEVNAYRGLSADQATYNEFVEMTVERAARGELTDEQKEHISELAEQWATAHNQATEALRVYLRVKDPVSKENYLEAATRLREVVALVQQVMEAWK